LVRTYATAPVTFDNFGDGNTVTGIVKSAGGSVSEVFDSGATRFSYAKLVATSVGTTFDANVHAPLAGTYTLKVSSFKSKDSAIADLRVNGAFVASNDIYTATTPGFYEEKTFPNITLNAGRNTFRWTITGKTGAPYVSGGITKWIYGLDALTMETTLNAGTTNTNLVGYYQMEQNGTDSSGSVNNAIAKGGTVAYATSTVGGVYAASFNGTGTRLVAPDSASLRITGALTLACWVKPVSWSSQPNLINKSDNSGYRLRISSGGKLNLILGKDNLGNAVSLGGTALLTANTWQHVAATVSFSGTTATVKFYLNGVLSNTLTTTLSAIYGGTGPLSLGTRGDANAESLNGLLDEVSIYKSALSATEIAALAN
jgi:hypothetical protein